MHSKDLPNISYFIVVPTHIQCILAFFNLIEGNCARHSHGEDRRASVGLDRESKD